VSYNVILKFFAAITVPTILVGGLWHFPLNNLSGWIFLLTNFVSYVLALISWVSGSSLLLALLILLILTTLSLAVDSQYLTAVGVGLAFGVFNTIIHKSIYEGSE
jgi:hypothetical protein